MIYRLLPSPITRHEVREYPFSCPIELAVRHQIHLVLELGGGKLLV